MKLKRSPDWLLIVLGIIICALSTAAILGERPLLALCQRDCSINVLLHLMFGNERGRIVFGMIGYLFASMSFYSALVERNKD
jgi:hypothetical protein